MSVQKPLSKRRLFEILDRYEPGVTMDMVGGYDTGMYFRFKGKARDASAPADRIVGGRVFTGQGFCSEAMMQTREEFQSRHGSAHGVGLFMARCEKRRATLERWLAEYGSTVADGGRIELLD